jgi:hypothetical protein
LISSGNKWFDRLNQLFECAVVSEFKPDNLKPAGQQQQQQQAGDFQTLGDKKGSFRPCISEPVENTVANSNVSGTINS